MVSSPQQITDNSPFVSSKTPHVESVECSITICIALSPFGTEVTLGVAKLVPLLVLPYPNEPDSSTPQHSIVFSTIAQACDSPIVME